MASIIPGYEYDIFISYRHNDNLDGWVSDFVRNLEKELKRTIKVPISIYFDTNSHDGLLETHNVEKSLESKLKCLIFIPIISRTYCDTKSYAWQNEFCAFNTQAKEDELGVDINLANGNVTSRILPVKIHDIDKEDSALLERELGGVLRAIEFFHKTSGVNRPLTTRDDEVRTPGKILYFDQLNKIANAVQEILRGIKNKKNTPVINEVLISEAQKMPFRKKLRRRGVLKASLTYILIALVLWKVLVISSDLLNLTENAIHLITLILIILFPFAMLLAWFFERSPQGFISTYSVDSLENIFRDEQKKPFTSIGFISVLLVITIVLFFLFPTAIRTQSMNSVADIDRSIAVLPFKNLSNNPEDQYFSDGMKEEILNHLFKIGSLKIPSGSSTLRFKESKLSVSEIAQELNVSYLLEGNVSKFDNNIRIIVSLINGKNGDLVWTEDYRRSMTASDILDIQSDVALQVAANLKIMIDPEVRKRIETRPTENTEAYTLFLQARETHNYSYEKASQMLEKAVSLDPGFADAYAEMAFARMWYMGDTLSREQILEKVEPLLSKALQLNFNSIVAHNTLAEIRFWYYWDLETVEKEYQIVRQLNPSNSGALFGFKYYLWRVGKAQEAYTICKDNFEQNKTTGYSWIFMANAFSAIGEKEKTLETIETALRIFPHKDYLIRNANRIFVELGEYKKAINLFEKELSTKDLHVLQAEIIAPIGIAYYKTGNLSKSNEILNELISRNRNFARNEASFSAAQIYTAMGEKDKALLNLDKAYNRHEMSMVNLKVDPFFKVMHGDPRFENLLLKIGSK
jgi:TolB-like protein/Tfp pilus assembly protein PilF